MSPTPTQRLRRARRRASAAARLLALRTELAVLARVAPERADRRALDLWCTLPAVARRRDARPGPGDLVRVPVPRGGTAVTEVWGVGPVVYLMHGWGGWRGQLGAFVAPLVAAGHRVVAVDAPSHGDSDAGFFGPGRGTVMEFIEALEAAVAQHGPAAGVVAHSMGTVAAAQAVADGLAVERLVLLAPSHPFAEVLDEFARLLRLRPATREHLAAALEEVAGRPMAAFDLESIAHRHPMPPTLVVHDRDDRQTPFRVGESVAATWPDARLVATSGLGHHRVLGSRVAVTAAVEHLTARADVGARPAGTGTVEP